MTRQWIVAARIACVGGLTGFMPGDRPLQAFWTRRGALKALADPRTRKSNGLHSLDSLDVRSREPGDARYLDAWGLPRNRPAIVIKTIEGRGLPMHPDAKSTLEARREALRVKLQA